MPTGGALGPGAHSHVGGVRWWNVKHPVRYAAMLEAGHSPAAGRESLDEQARLTERVMLGIRMRAGLAVDELPRRRRSSCCRSWRRGGWPSTRRRPTDRVALTQRGRLLADAVVRELLG